MIAAYARFPLQRRVDVGQRGRAVHARLARAEEVQVGAVEDEDVGHGQTARSMVFSTNLPDKYLCNTLPIKVW